MEQESWYVDLRITTGPSCEIVIWPLTLLNSSYSMDGVCSRM